METSPWTALPIVQHHFLPRAAGTAVYVNLDFVQRVKAVKFDRYQNTPNRLAAGPIPLGGPNPVPATTGTTHNRSFSALNVGRTGS